MKRILVTGSNGQLGKTLRDLTPEYPDLEFYFKDKTVLDITQAEEVVNNFQEIQPNYCINCAAYTKVDQAERIPDLAYAVNVKGVELLVDACLASDTILIHLSTDYVFDGTKEEGYSQDDTPNPINVYGSTKLEGERKVLEKMKKFFIVRTSWLYSKKHGHNFYKTILSKAKAGHFLTVTDKQRGCPTDARNLAKYLLNLIASESTEYGIKHFTDGEAMTWYAFAKRILKNEGYYRKSNLKKGENYRTFAKRPVNSVLRVR